MRILLLLLTPLLLLTSCDMGTPAPSQHPPKVQRAAEIKLLTVIFKDGDFVFVPITKNANGNWTANLSDRKKVKIKSKTPSAIASELFGDRVKTSRWAGEK
jgi:hypothetical protein